MVILELKDPQRCHEMEYYLELLRGLDLTIDTENLLDRFVSEKFLLAEAAISHESFYYASEMIDFFRRRKLREVVKAYLFVDEALVESSHDNKPATSEIISEFQIPVTSAQ